MMTQQVVQHKRKMRKQSLCLMVGHESSSSSETSSPFSKDKNDYYQYLHGFEELHDETNRHVVVNNWLKGLNKLLENKINLTGKELTDLKENFENLDMIYKPMIVKIS